MNEKKWELHELGSGCWSVEKAPEPPWYFSPNDAFDAQRLMDTLNALEADNAALKAVLEEIVSAADNAIGMWTPLAEPIAKAHSLLLQFPPAAGTKDGAGAEEE